MTDLMEVLDFILNRCTVREIDAVAEAVKRRRRDLETSCGTGSLDPGQLASQLSAAVTQSIDKSISGMQESFRDFAWDMIRKEAPELSDEQTEKIVRTMIPDMSELRKRQGAASGARSAAVAGNIPSAAMSEMAFQFAAYSTGGMSPAEDQALRSSVGKDWPKSYWDVFPDDVKAVIKAYVEDGLDGEAFRAAVSVLLS